MSSPVPLPPQDDQTWMDWASWLHGVVAGLSALATTAAPADLVATGTKSSTTFLRGDETWAVPAGSTGGGVNVYNAAVTYGADKTGATSAVTAVQNAINAASTAGGGVVYLPAGTYMWNGTPPQLKSKVKLLGDGLDVTKIYQNSNTAAGLAAVDQEDIVIEGLSILGTEAGTNTGLALSRSTAPDIGGITLRQVHITGFQTSIDLSNPITSTFDRVLLDTGQTGFSIHGVPGAGGSAGTSVTFLNCYTAGLRVGTRIENMVYCGWVGAASDNCGIAYELTGSGTQGLAFVGSGCESGTFWDSTAPGIGWKINAAIGVSLSGCFSYDMPDKSVWITGAAKAVNVTGFSENTPQSGVVNSIKVDTGCTVVLDSVATIKPLSVAAGTTTQLNVNGGGDLSTIVDTTPITATDLGLAAPKGARAYANATGQTLTAGTYPVYLDVNTIDFNEDATLYTIDLTNNKITVLSGGLFLISWDVSFADSANLREAYIAKNGGNAILSAAAGSGGQTGRTSPIRLVANDYVQVITYVETTGTSLVTNAPHRCGLGLYRIGL